MPDYGSAISDERMALAEELHYRKLEEDKMQRVMKVVNNKKANSSELRGAIDEMEVDHPVRGHLLRQLATLQDSHRILFEDFCHPTFRLGRPIQRREYDEAKFEKLKEHNLVVNLSASEWRMLQEHSKEIRGVRYLFENDRWAKLDKRAQPQTFAIDAGDSSDAKSLSQWSIEADVFEGANRGDREASAPRIEPESNPQAGNPHFDDPEQREQRVEERRARLRDVNPAQRPRDARGHRWRA